MHGGDPTYLIQVDGGGGDPDQCYDVGVGDPDQCIDGGNLVTLTSALMVWVVTLTSVLMVVVVTLTSVLMMRLVRRAHGVGGDPDDGLVGDPD